MRQASLDKTAGWLLVGLGAVHTVVTPFLARRTWAQVADEGWWDTFTIATATTFDELQRSEAFWSSVGSYGLPAGALGGYIVWSSSKNQEIAAWLGWGLLVHGTVLSTLLPRSGPFRPQASSSSSATRERAPGAQLRGSV